MPLTIAKTQLEKDVAGCIRAYWQIRAANAALLHFSNGQNWKNFELKFENIHTLPQILIPGNQKMHDALAEIQEYIRDGRAVSEHFMNVISFLESFLVKILISKGKSTEGTLGQLTTRVEDLFGLNLAQETIAMKEIRERRNTLVHNHGVAQTKYITACIHPSLPANLRATLINQHVPITDDYFSYVCTKIIDYSRQF